MTYILYSRATKGGGAVVKSTFAGGGVVKSTSSGGGTTATSSSGGGTSTSTQSGGGSTQSSSVKSFPDSIFISSAPSAGGYDNHTHTTLFNADNMSHSHTVNIPSHNHNFSTPNHTHTVNIPNHSHSMDIPNHSHEINIPDHAHEIEHGIFKLDRMPTKVTIKVDGKPIPHTDLSGDSIDLIPYLSRDSEERVQRGWHTVEITPNDLGRINAQLMTQFFMQSRGGVDA
ncbi:hypothetical protein SPD48_14430 [Pseudogracilibacillus sp. SE30717A]|uniref:hypothetical protein n=1 Tax=Pseudogracilibacillus sp. SE30717A TaxID=3098293 RepID=UPI00300DF6BC